MRMGMGNGSVIFPFEFHFRRCFCQAWSVTDLLLSRVIVVVVLCKSSSSSRKRSSSISLISPYCCCCCCAMTLNCELIELTLTSRVTCEQQQITLKARVVMYTNLSLNLMTLSLSTALLAHKTYMATLHLALSTRNQSTCSLSHTCLPTRYLTHLCTL